MVLVPAREALAAALAGERTHGLERAEDAAGAVRFSGGHDRNHLAAVTRATSRVWSRRRDRDQVDRRLIQ